MKAENLYGPLMMLTGLIIVSAHIFSGNSSLFSFVVIAEQTLPSMYLILIELFNTFWYGMSENIIMGLIFVYAMPKVAGLIFKMLGYVGLGMSLGILIYPYGWYIMETGVMDYVFPVLMVLLISYEIGMWSFRIVKRLIGWLAYVVLLGVAIN